MKIKPAIGLTLAVLGSVDGFAATLNAGGNDLSKFHYRAYGDGAETQFVSVDTSTCAAGIERKVVLNAVNGQEIQNKDGVGFTSVFAAFSVFDHCLNMVVYSASGGGSRVEFDHNPNLKSASLRGTFVVSDSDGNFPEVVVDLVWNGAGQRDRDSDHVEFNDGFVHYVTNSTGTIREAIAGGSIVIGGTDFAPLPSTTALIEKNSVRYVAIDRN